MGFVASANLDLVRSIYANWERGDFSSAEWAHPVHSYHHGRGKTSGLELGQMRSEGTTLFHVRGGKVTKLVMYVDRERALADLGLAE